MKNSSAGPALAVLLAITGCPQGAAAPAAPAAIAADGCRMADADRQWLDEAIAHWRLTARDLLKLPTAALPRMVMFDARCSYALRAGADPERGWTIAPHDGQVALPDGKRIPASVTSFAAPAAGGAEGYFVMGLPSVWRAGGVTSGIGLETLMHGVLLHEMTHVHQFAFADPALREVTRHHALGEDIDDDSLQRAYEGNADYVAAYQAERDLLFAAAAAPNEADARALAGEALARMRARRAHHFTGPAAHWATLDEIFLTTEGLGQWAAYAWLTDARGPGMSPVAALPEIRRGGRSWSQDEGLALFLVVDRLVPGWQARAFAATPETAEALLARACGCETQGVAQRE